MADKGVWDECGWVRVRQVFEERGGRYDVDLVSVVEGVHIWHVDQEELDARGVREPRILPWERGGRRMITRGTHVRFLERVLDVGIDVEPAYSADQGYAFWGDRYSGKPWEFTAKYGMEGMMLVYDAAAVQSSECDPAVAPRTYTDARGRVHGTRFGPQARNCRENEPQWGCWFPGSPRPYLLHIVLNSSRSKAVARLDALGERSGEERKRV